MKLVAGVIGCGNISKFHFSGLEKAGARIQWVCDLMEDAAAPWVQKYGARYTADYKQVLADPEVNVVNVAAIAKVHKPVCLGAIKAGKAVICEKTLAENPGDAAAIVRAAEAKGTVFYTSYMKRFIPAVEEAKRLLPSIGPVMSTHIRTYQHWGLPWKKVPANVEFFAAPCGRESEVRKRYGGGILVCGGSHILDLLCFLLGRPQRLWAHMHTPEGTDLDTQAAAMMETGNGIVHFEALAHPLKRIGFLCDGWDERVEINGENGRLDIYSAKWDDVESKTSLLVHYDNKTGRSTEYRFDAESPFDRAMAFFCKNIARGKQGPQSRQTGYDVDELIAHIQRSAATGRALDIKWRI